MKKFSFLLFLLSLSSFAKANNERAPQGLEDRVRSEFGLDRFEVTCEYVLSGKSIDPKHVKFYEEISKSACIKNAQNELQNQSKKFNRAIVEHDELDKSLVIFNHNREKNNEK